MNTVLGILAIILFVALMWFLFNTKDMLDRAEIMLNRIELFLYRLFPSEDDQTDAIEEEGESDVQ